MVVGDKKKIRGFTLKVGEDRFQIKNIIREQVTAVPQFRYSFDILFKSDIGDVPFSEDFIEEFLPHTLTEKEEKEALIEEIKYIINRKLFQRKIKKFK